MTDHDADLAAILENAEVAGLVETYVDTDGQQAMRLTPDGERVARELSMLGEGRAGRTHGGAA